MEQKSTTIWKSALTYGAYLGLISILISVVVWAGALIESMGMWGGAIIGLVSILISFFLVLFFTKAYRNKEMGGYISFGKAFQFALLIVIVSTVISTIYNYIFHSFIAPDYMENLMAVMQQNTMAYMENMGAPEASIDTALEKFEEPITLWKTLRQGLLGGLIGGAIVALIVAAIAKKRVEE